MSTQLEGQIRVTGSYLFCSTKKIEFFSFSSAEDLFRLSENFQPTEFQYQSLPSMNYMSHSYYPKKCDGLCEWTCKLCKVFFINNLKLEHFKIEKECNENG